MTVKIFAFLLSLGLSTYAFADSAIMGTIKFDGKAPHAKRLYMEADPVCNAFYNGKAVYAKNFVLGDGNTLGNVFVYVKSGLPPAHYPVPAGPAVITQQGCNYSPHVLAVRAGQTVKFLNPDATFHNVHVMSKINPEFNAAMPDFRKEMDVTFNKPELMFQVRCDVHPWMIAWMAVMDNPFFAVTKSDGKFELKHLPAGTYTIDAWHEKLGTQTATVTIKDGEARRLDFTFSAPKS